MKLDGVDRFWNKVRIGDGCWEWHGAKNEAGYGLFTLVKGTTQSTHRIAWELERGQIPDGAHVLHTCDNRSCVRPSHLFLGTHLDNMRDMRAKGRRASFRGEDNGRSKLTDENVRAIRAALALGGRIKSRISREFGVSDTLVGLIAAGRIWTHVK